VNARLLALGLLSVLLAACGANAAAPEPSQTADLDALSTIRIGVGGVEFEVWLAQTPAQQQQGLMFATPEQLAPLADGTPRGMLFVFDPEQMVTFFMRNTFVPLDLAYVRFDRSIAATHDLVPLDETLVPSSEPVAFALEVPAGTFAGLGVDAGDAVSIP